MKNEWISVKDKLPKDDMRVLVYRDDYTDSIYFGRYFYSLHEPRDVPIFGIGGIGQTDKVTHWMPLPEPPKQ